ncbi:MAG TPA: TIGR01777 family oxidoreductase [Gemmatimonadales bacterium]|nr:TIGR01777 family oxidoreductase [Gemmatimonadales bacterium]
MNILVSGGSGFIGTALVAGLRADGHRVRVLTRRLDAAGPEAPFWNPEAGELDRAAFRDVDAVINLSGSTIATRWNAEKKKEIRESRVRCTTLLAETIASLESRPGVFISTSATGYYGDRGDEVIAESASPGQDFLAGVCVAWEAAAVPAARSGVRVVHPRLGLVLSPAGGVLKQALPPFRAGIGGPLGSGKQWWSWIVLHDVVAGFRHALMADGLRGPVNFVAPGAVPNAAFAKTLGTVLGRPSAMPVPTMALKLLFGEAADGAILTGVHAIPAALEQTGFQFAHPELEPALRHLLT